MVDAPSKSRAQAINHPQLQFATNHLPLTIHLQSMSDVAAIEKLVAKRNALKKEISKIIVGQDAVVDEILLCIFSGGHALLVGVPGLAKTLMVNTIARALGLDFKRIQFTPDLMPSDILGSEILDENRQFKFIKGPLFANIILADEINRTPPKTQAALLEAMQERAVTIAGTNYKLSLPYFVLATQNPIEQEGTYPLPEAQLDRFMFAIKLDYPSFAEEVQVVKTTTGDASEDVGALFTAEEIIEFQHLIRRVPVPDNVIEYAVTLVSKTRPNNALSNDYVKNYLDWGAGPRASQNLVLAAKAHAAFNGKFSPDIEDIKAVATGVLRHRIIKNYKADAEGISEEAIIGKLL
jgi:MoxR-like ATPase